MTVTHPEPNTTSEMLDALASEDWDRTRQAAETVLETDADDVRAMFVLGLAAFHQGDLATAATATHRAMETDGDVQELARVLSVYYALAGDVNNSLYFGKLSTALPAQAA